MAFEHVQMQSAAEMVSRLWLSHTEEEKSDVCQWYESSLFSIQLLIHFQVYDIGDESSFVWIQSVCGECQSLRGPYETFDKVRYGFW